MGENDKTSSVTEIREQDPWRTIRVDRDGVEVTHPNGSKTGIRLDTPETRRKVATALAPDLVPVPDRETLEAAMIARAQEYSIPNCGPQVVHEFADEALRVMHRAGRQAEIEQAAIDAFKEAWHEADSEGASGDRVRRGLRAALKVMKEQN